MTDLYIVEYENYNLYNNEFVSSHLIKIEFTKPYCVVNTLFSENKRLGRSINCIITDDINVALKFIASELTNVISIYKLRNELDNSVNLMHALVAFYSSVVINFGSTNKYVKLSIVKRDNNYYFNVCMYCGKTHLENLVCDENIVLSKNEFKEFNTFSSLMLHISSKEKLKLIKSQKLSHNELIEYFSEMDKIIKYIEF